jgi:hypothetical protein
MSPVVSHFAFGTLFLTLFAVFTPLLRKALDRVADPDPFLLAAMPCVALTGLFGFGAIEFGRAALGVEGVARYAVAAAAVDP